MKRYLGLALFVSIMLFSGETMGQSMGWLSTSGSANSGVYFDTANWLNGDVNGVFGTNLTSKSWPQITFTNDFNVTSNTFKFAYPGEVLFTFRGEGTNVKATLLDDLEIQPLTTKGSITFGSLTDGQKLNLDLGNATRTFNIKVPLYIMNTASNGNIVATGPSVLLFRGPEAALENGYSITVEQGTAMRFGDENDQDSGCLRASGVRIESATLQAFAHKYGSVSVDTVDTFTCAPAPGNGGTPAVYFRTSNLNENLHVNNFVRYHHGIINIDCNNMLALGTSDFTSGVNFTASNGIDSYGIGGAGEMTCAIVPWARNFTSFMVYDETRGFRLLDSETERRTYPTNYIGSVVAEGENIYIAGGGWTIDFTNAVNTVNSLSTAYSSGDTWIHVTNGVLKVLSGGIMLDANNVTHLNANLDFGNVRGYIVDRAGKGQNLSGSIAGSNGVTIANYNLVNVEWTGGTGINVYSTGNTFTGDFNLHGRISLQTTDLFPFGSRLGNTVIDGLCMFGNSAEIKMNGFYGDGLLALGNGYVVDVIVGDNDSAGDFGGNFRRTNGTLSLKKIGTGTQRFSGECSHNGATTIEAGTLMFDCPVYDSTITVDGGATLAGAGEILKAGTNVIINAGGILSPGSTNGVGALSIAGGISFDGDAAMNIYADQENGYGSISVGASVAGSGSTVSVEVTGEDRGEWLILQAASIEPNFICVTPGASLSLRADGTELWLIKNPQGSVFIIQ